MGRVPLDQLVRDFYGTFEQRGFAKKHGVELRTPGMIDGVVNKVGVEICAAIDIVPEEPRVVVDVFLPINTRAAGLKVGEDVTRDFESCGGKNKNGRTFLADRLKITFSTREELVRALAEVVELVERAAPIITENQEHLLPTRRELNGTRAA